jgi:hypothetical protein
MEVEVAWQPKSPGELQIPSTKSQTMTNDKAQMPNKAQNSNDKEE